MSDYNSNNATKGRGRRRRGGRNRSHRGGGDYIFTPNRAPKQTGFQKFLSVITFGLLGKPKPRPQAKPAPQPAKREPGPIARADAEARQSQRRENREPRAPRAPISTEVNSERLYVGNLSYDASESDLFELFNGSGRVKNAEVVVNNRTQRSKGFAFVTMQSVDEAKKAVADLNGKDFMGRPLVVGGAKPAPEGRREDRGESAAAADASDDVIRPPEEDTEEQHS